MYSQYTVDILCESSSLSVSVLYWHYWCIVIVLCPLFFHNLDYGAMAQLPKVNNVWIYGCGRVDHTSRAKGVCKPYSICLIQLLLPWFSSTVRTMRSTDAVIMNTTLNRGSLGSWVDDDQIKICDRMFFETYTSTSWTHNAALLLSIAILGRDLGCQGA